MASSSSARDHSTPTPVGPHILWPLKARKSAPSSTTSVGRWGTDWQASTRQSAPTACAASANWRTGVMVPSTLDTADTPTSFTPSSRRSRPVRSSRPSLVRGIQRSSMPRSAASWCQGTMLAWCSSSVISTTSPSARLFRPHEWATRLMDSVAFLVNSTSRSDGAPMKRWTARRASSMAAVARSAMW